MRCFFRVFLPELLYLRTGMLFSLFPPLSDLSFFPVKTGGLGGGATGWILREKKMENSFLQKKVESAPAGGEWGAERGFF